MFSHNTYRLTWVSLTLYVGYLFRLLQQSAAAAPYLGRGLSPHGAPPDLECGVAPLGPPAPVQPQLLGCGVAPPIIVSICLSQTPVCPSPIPLSLWELCVCSLHP